MSNVIEPAFCATEDPLGASQPDNYRNCQITGVGRTEPTAGLFFLTRAKVRRSAFPERPVLQFTNLTSLWGLVGFGKTPTQAPWTHTRNAIRVFVAKTVNYSINFVEA
jgi:hypothetical protein